MKPAQLLARIGQGRVDNVRFSDLIRLCRKLGFEIVRVSGSHHILARDGFAELLNLQEVHGDAKPYQVRQLVKLVERYNLRIEGDL
ncbi:MAG: type II toxin-antitoxin system HicA family toxin [Acidimicrobiia bacterium]|nr:type II toxin-antitoxin system HicA family toxin [Acidimicrobiia bacterium]